MIKLNLLIIIGRPASLLTLFSAMIGCGPGDSKVPVVGMITFDDSPMPDGYVTLTPDGGGSPVASPIVAGKFELAARPGPYRVEIEASRFVGEKNPIMGLQPREHYVPARYNSATTLRCEVKRAGGNSFNYELMSEQK